MEMVDPLDIRHGNKILLFLLERGEIKKTDLLEIMSSSDSLSRSLHIVLFVVTPIIPEYAFHY